MGRLYDPIILALLRGCTSESMNPRPCFLALQYRFRSPIQFTIVLGVLGTQETLCYLVAGLLERDHLHPTPPMD